MDVGSVWWDFLNRVFFSKTSFYYMFGMTFVEDKCAFISLKAPFVVNQLVASPLNVFARNPMYEVCDFHGR